METLQAKEIARDNGLDEEFISKVKYVSEVAQELGKEIAEKPHLVEYQKDR
jgi:hypothetical protein